MTRTKATSLASSLTASRDVQCMPPSAAPRSPRCKPDGSLHLEQLAADVAARLRETSWLERVDDSSEDLQRFSRCRSHELGREPVRRGRTGANKASPRASSGHYKTLCLQPVPEQSCCTPLGRGAHRSCFTARSACGLTHSDATCCSEPLPIFPSGESRSKAASRTSSSALATNPSCVPNGGTASCIGASCPSSIAANIARCGSAHRPHSQSRSPHGLASPTLRRVSGR